MDLKGKVILFADDDLYNMQSTRDALEVRGAIIRLATDGTEVLQYFRDHKDDPPDLLILDVMMAEGEEIKTTDSGRSTGLEVYRRIRQQFSRLPIVVSTVVTDDKILSRFEGDSKTAVIRKGYRFTELQGKISSVC